MPEPIRKWVNYTQYLYYKSGETDLVYRETFTYLATLILGGAGFSNGAEEYFNEKMEYDLVEYLGGYDFSDKSVNVQKQVCAQILGWLLENGKNYEKVISQHAVRLDDEHFQQLKNVEGNSYHEKIVWLMENKTSSEEVCTRKGVHRFTWNFTYSEELVWQELPGDSDREKLTGLLDYRVKGGV